MARRLGSRIIMLISRQNVARFKVTRHKHTFVTHFSGNELSHTSFFGAESSPGYDVTVHATGRQRGAALQPYIVSAYT